MTTRFDAKDAVNYGVQGIKSGYDGLESSFNIPACGIEDVDIALFNLFDKEINLTVGGQDSSPLKKVPVLFAAGEKWALLKNNKPLRDRNSTLILPLLTIMRTGVSQEKDADIAGRGINQQTGEIVVRRRLDKTDRDYQNLINRLFIENQLNVAVNPGTRARQNQLTSDRRVGSLRGRPSTQRGALLQANRTNNIFETIVVPTPQFYSATYDISVWVHYTQHMNQLTETLMSSFLPQGQAWKLTSPKGYWFVASVQESFETETNFDDMSSSERYIRLKFTVKVPAYVWASDAPGVPVPVKRYISSPIISFQTEPQRAATDGVVPEENAEEFANSFLIGSDDPTLPLDTQSNIREDQRSPGWRQQFVFPGNSGDIADANDPALTGLPAFSALSGDPSLPGYVRNASIRARRNSAAATAYTKLVIGGETRYVRVTKVNPQTGETVYSAYSPDSPFSSNSQYAGAASEEIDGIQIIPVRTLELK